VFFLFMHRLEKWVELFGGMMRDDRVVLGLIKCLTEVFEGI